MKLDRAAIARRVPHAGTMCLLDTVLDWDGATIDCEAPEPGPAHPLARDGRLPAIAAAEYAAQATAVHGALLDGLEIARPGMLAKLTGLELGVDPVAPAGGRLAIHCELLGRTDAGCQYGFLVCNARGLLARGRMIVATQSVDTRAEPAP